jgi:hypothetical protein
MRRRVFDQDDFMRIIITFEVSRTRIEGDENGQPPFDREQGDRHYVQRRFFDLRFQSIPI